VDRLLEIFKVQARMATTRLDRQRQHQQVAHTQRVCNETNYTDHEHDIAQPPAPTPQRVTTSPRLPTVEFTEINEHGPTIPTITQENETFSPPAHNTRQHQTRRTLTQEVALHISETREITQSGAQQWHPSLTSAERVAAVLDDETGKLLEYRHLLKNPKYHDFWSKSFGTEL
jgi:hypothetical protein